MAIYLVAMSIGGIVWARYTFPEKIASGTIVEQLSGYALAIFSFALMASLILVPIVVLFFAPLLLMLLNFMKFIKEQSSGAKTVVLSLLALVLCCGIITLIGSRTDLNGPSIESTPRVAISTQKPTSSPYKQLPSFAARPTNRKTPHPTPKKTPAPQIILDVGSRGAETKELQYILTALGYNLGAIDGVYGAKTEAALKQFQADYGLPATGVGDSSTIQTLLDVYEAAGRPEVVEIAQQEYVYYVYITRYGSRYHSVPNCGNTKYATQVTYEYAVQCGYTACGNCY